jgi:hypothetical protein
MPEAAELALGWADEGVRPYVFCGAVVLGRLLGEALGPIGQLFNFFNQFLGILFLKSVSNFQFRFTVVPASPCLRLRFALPATMPCLVEVQNFWDHKNVSTLWC